MLPTKFVFVVLFVKFLPGGSRPFGAGIINGVQTNIISSSRDRAAVSSGFPVGHEQKLVSGQYIKQRFTIWCVVDLDWGDLERELLDVPFSPSKPEPSPPLQFPSVTPISYAESLGFVVRV
jgi:hypothetical protein